MESNIKLPKVNIINIKYYCLFYQSLKKVPSTSILNKKTKRIYTEEEEEEEKNNSINLKKAKSLSKNYISLIKHKNVSLSKKLNCEKRHLSKVEYINNEYSYEIKKLFNEEDKKKKIRNINIISIGNKRKLFLLSENEILIYEIKDDFFCVNFVKEIPHKMVFRNDNIKYYFIFKYKNNIYFNFFNYCEIKLYLFDYNTNEFIFKKNKFYSKDKTNKYFYYMKKNNQFIIFKCDEAIIYDFLFTNCKTLISLEDYHKVDLIRSFKELSENLLCFIFSNSISIYDFYLKKNIGTITDILPKIIKLIENNGKKNILILTLGDINLYEIENLTFSKKLYINKIKNIEKIKQLSNLDIAILYGENNLAIYDLKKNIIKYQIKTESNQYKYCLKNYFLNEIGNNILIYNPSRYCLHILDYTKGQVKAKFNDGLNKIKRLKKINNICFDEINDEKILKEKIKFYFIINQKGYFVLKINGLNGLQYFK